jgi:hypothetical protein
MLSLARKSCRDDKRPMRRWTLVAPLPIMGRTDATRATSTAIWPQSCCKLNQQELQTSPPWPTEDTMSLLTSTKKYVHGVLHSMQRKTTY